MFFLYHFVLDKHTSTHSPAYMTCGALIRELDVCFGAVPSAKMAASMAHHAWIWLMIGHCNVMLILTTTLSGLRLMMLFENMMPLIPINYNQINVKFALIIQSASIELLTAAVSTLIIKDTREGASAIDPWPSRTTSCRRHCEDNPTLRHLVTEVWLEVMVCYFCYGMTQLHTISWAQRICEVSSRVAKWWNTCVLKRWFGGC